MKVVLFGAIGMVGSRIAEELTRRSHETVAASRASGDDATDPERVAALARDADAVISAVAARDGDYTNADVARSLLDGVRRVGGRRLIVVGGAGSLEVSPGQRLVDTPDFHQAWKPEALAQADALDVYRVASDVDWTYVSPAAVIAPGARKGRYRTGGDHLLVDAAGRSQISAEDFAIAVVDLLENGGHLRERVTFAY
jgi:putative NADH-flavin reductase